MSQRRPLITFSLEVDWTPEQAWAVHEVLDALLAQIERHYGMAVQQWLCGAEHEDDPCAEMPLAPVETDFDDPLPF